MNPTLYIHSHALIENVTCTSLGPGNSNGNKIQSLPSKVDTLVGMLKDTIMYKVLHKGHQERLHKCLEAWNMVTGGNRLRKVQLFAQDTQLVSNKVQDLNPNLPGSIYSRRVRHDWSNLAHMHTWALKAIGPSGDDLRFGWKMGCRASERLLSTCVHSMSCLNIRLP